MSDFNYMQRNDFELMGNSKSKSEFWMHRLYKINVNISKKKIAGISLIEIIDRDMMIRIENPKAMIAKKIIDIVLSEKVAGEYKKEKKEDARQFAMF